MDSIRTASTWTLVRVSKPSIIIKAYLQAARRVQLLLWGEQLPQLLVLLQLILWAEIQQTHSVYIWESIGITAALSRF